jgi:hypothetical protein
MMTQKKGIIIGIGLVIIEVAMLFLFFSFTFSSHNVVLAVIGSPNATVQTLLEIGNVYPEILNISINEDTSITLLPNTTRLVSCAAVLRDYNGQADIDAVNATFYALTSSSYGAADDNNYHYTNTSCVINTSFGSYNGYSDDAYSALANCTFAVHYYAVPESWGCQVWVTDIYDWTANDTNNETINQLLAIGLPNNINYGVVNATYVSNENITNVTNLGNVYLNLSLEGYGAVEDDGYAFNCTQGNVQNISVQYEKYNLTASNPGVITHAQAMANYTNLSSGNAPIRFYNLSYRLNDSDPFDATKQSYWRVFVPVGVAGNCTGNIIFGATTAAATP